ncbi:MAG: glycosyltransferase family 2 protein [Candidatus Omnitrophota bacterium]
MQVSSNKIVSVVIVAGGIKGYLESCLDSLEKQTYKKLEVVVIDNSLNRDFSRQIAGRFPRVRLYSEPKNIFYAGALNKGINVSGGDFILCLNDDVVLDGRFIQEALRGFDAADSVGMVCGRILRSDGKTIDSTGLFLSLWRTAKERGYGIKDRGRHICPGHVFGAGGAAAFYRRSMLEKIKCGPEYFDPDFRMFYEDLDVAWRANLFGWKGFYVPSAVAYHIRGGTARQGPGINKPFARRYLSDELLSDLVKNRYLTIIKNESVPGFILHLPFILAYDIFAFAYLLIFKPGVLKRIFLNLKYLKSALDKRTILNSRRRQC